MIGTPLKAYTRATTETNISLYPKPNSNVSTPPTTNAIIPTAKLEKKVKDVPHI